MIPCSFDGETAVLEAPEGMGLDQCEVLSVRRTQTANGMPVVVSCWKPTREEMERIAMTGRVWLVVAGVTMPPVILTAHEPLDIE